VPTVTVPPFLVQLPDELTVAGNTIVPPLIKMSPAALIVLMVPDPAVKVPPDLLQVKL